MQGFEWEFYQLRLWSINFIFACGSALNYASSEQKNAIHINSRSLYTYSIIVYTHIAQVFFRHNYDNHRFTSPRGPVLLYTHQPLQKVACFTVPYV